MAIAGIKPNTVTYFQRHNETKTIVDTMTMKKMQMDTYIVPHEFTGYTEKQVREILIKFANSKNAMRRDMPAEQIVDEFMESEDHE
ncbi:hypothetical protein KQH86_04290 [Weissella confusa]|uniref:hypothetical protein n=1 Tax=Weissella confusa TaxID=1583 RepID=UPI001C11A086|nr:hypothetical protein [Weissella confusa]MBU5285312.1 hypothetical protein [Weissella confusa]